MPKCTSDDILHDNCDCDQITHDIKCDSCGKTATRNVQQCWVEWDLKPDGEYSEDPTDIDAQGDNYHYCDNCDS